MASACRRWRGQSNVTGIVPVSVAKSKRWRPSFVVTHNSSGRRSEAAPAFCCGPAAAHLVCAVYLNCCPKSWKDAAAIFLVVDISESVTGTRVRADSENEAALQASATAARGWHPAAESAELPIPAEGGVIFCTQQRFEADIRRCRTFESR
mmetsp:Transcript_26972/g.60899  ORF Transcript_26972/g.60899 Transcript_26972/m.60899 type:complete len:151 (-) Transcript_26972:462-914(-)